MSPNRDFQGALPCEQAAWTLVLPSKRAGEAKRALRACGFVIQANHVAGRYFVDIARGLTADPDRRATIIAALRAMISVQA